MKIEDYLNQLKANGLNPGTIKNYNKVLRTLNKFMQIETISKKEELVAFFNQLDRNDSTINLYKILIKRFFKDIGKGELVDWIQRKKLREKLKADDIITPDEVNLMIETTESYYWKALIAFLFETGSRISEARSIRYKDCNDTDKGMIVHIPTSKTSAGFRKVILPFSSQYIRNLKIYNNASSDDLVFKISSQRTIEIFARIGQKAGIRKHVSPHMFRHAQATDMVRRGYNEAIIRKKLGWTATSSMIARYQHLNDEDVVNATLENTGKLPQNALPRIEIKEAERLSLVDSSLLLSKVIAEVEELKSQNSMLIQDKIDSMDSKKVYDEKFKSMENEMKNIKDFVARVLSAVPSNIVEQVSKSMESK